MGVKENDPPEDGADTSQWTELLRSAARQLIPVVLTVGSLIGFVAFAGAVIVWTRFFAVDVPPDQAVKAVPRDELVATGSSLLLLFGFFGVLAVLVTYLVDRGGRATPGMSRGLLTLATLEGLIAIVVVSGRPLEETVVAAALLVLSACLVFAMTFVDLFARLEDSLAARPHEALEPKPSAGLFQTASGKLRSPASHLLKAGGLVLAGVALAAIVAVFDAPAAVRAMGFLVAAVVLFVAWVRVKVIGQEIAKSVAEEEEATQARKATEKRRRKGKARETAEEERLSKRRPHRLCLTLWGGLLIGALTLIAVLLSSLLLGEWWLTASLGVAAALGYGLWRVAALSRASFMWFGLAVFLSVPLFGTLTLMARNLADPQVQPMALIRSTDGPDEAIQGLYVTEADDRVYFANVATEGCGDAIASHSGRLLWVPKSEVVAMSVGPLQDIDEAATSALEMAYALTPAVETPAGDHVSLTVDEVEAKGTASTTLASSGGEQRLENAGPGVRPNFGSGLRLIPEIASPGQEIALRLSAPNAEVDGFGANPEGHTLRLDGVPVSVLREPALDAARAEYVRASDGTVLSLDKEGLYGEPIGTEEGFLRRFLAQFIPMREDPVFHYSLKDRPRYDRALFVKLEDSAMVDARAADRDDTGVYLEVNNRGELLGTPEVRLKGGKFMSLERQLLRQAWDEDEIRFRVPDRAASGVLTVDCGQLSSQPLLRVSRPPTARIAVRMQAGTGRIHFDSRRSSDDTGIASRRWTIGGLPRGEEAKMSRRLVPRLAPYRVRLTVTDKDGESDTAELHLLRLPASFFPFGKDQPERARLVRRIRAAVVRAAKQEAPTTIEVDGHADNVGSTADNLHLSLRRAVNVRKRVLTSAAAHRLALAAAVPVRTRAFGESCPLDPDGGRLRVNRRVEFFILGQDTQVTSPRGCHAGRSVRSDW